MTAAAPSVAAGPDLEVGQASDHSAAVRLIGAMFGALMREKGRRQHLELQRLVDELSGESSRG